MKIIIKKDAEETSRYGAAKFIAAMMQPGRVNMAPTAGSTPKRLYEIVTDFLQGNEAMIENNEVYYYQQDNLVATSRPEVPSFFPEIDQMFFEPNNVPEARIKRLTIESVKTAHEDIAAAGGLDFVLMGLGTDGHFAANMPGTPFENKGFMLEMPADVTAAIAKEYNAPDADAWTVLGPATLLQAKEIMLIVLGAGKADILQAITEGPITEAIPASILRLHPNLTIVCDEAAASKLTVK